MEDGMALGNSLGEMAGEKFCGLFEFQSGRLTTNSSVKNFQTI
jgi:hypothetical protein